MFVFQVLQEDCDTIIMLVIPHTLSIYPPFCSFKHQILCIIISHCTIILIIIFINKIINKSGLINYYCIKTTHSMLIILRTGI